MAENDLIITLTAVDNASAPIKNALGSIDNAQKQVKSSGVDAGKSIQEQFKETGKELRAFRQSMFVATAAVAVVISSVREAAKYNKDAKTSFDKFTTSITALSASVGSALAPALDHVTNLINFMRDAINAAIAGFIKMFTFIWESFGALQQGIKNIADNIKNIFTHKEDPMGIIEGFRTSFQKAMAISNAAADEFLNKVETTRARVEGGVTLKSEADQGATEFKRAEKDKEDAVKKRAEEESKLKKKAITDSKQLLADLAKENKAFAIINKAVSITESIINTAVGVTKALPNIPLAIAVGAIGAAQTALIASQGFAVGTPNVPYDMTAQIHKGETIIPATFADSIRRGELSLSGGGGSGGGGDIQINLYGVSINSKENVRELAEELGFEVDRKFRNARSRV